MADRIVVMEAGRIIDQGPPNVLYRNAAIFHRPDGERAPQVAELLYGLIKDGLIEESEFTAREDEAVDLLARKLEARQRRASHG